MVRGVQNVTYESADFYDGLKGAKPKRSLADTVGIDPTLYIDDGKVIRMTATEMFRDPVTYAGYLTGGSRECIELVECGEEDPVVAIFEAGQGMVASEFVKVTKKVSAVERKALFNLAAEKGPVALIYKGEELCVIASLVEAPVPA